MASQEFTDELHKAMLRGIHDRQGKWEDLNPAVEIPRIGDEVGLTRDQSFELLKHLLDEHLVFTRFLRAGDDPRLGQERRQRHIEWDDSEIHLGYELRLTITGRQLAGIA